MLPIDPIASLALSIHANPGVYALLVGSGLSRAASIPTGWGVTLDLIERLAAAQGNSTNDDPEGWFRERYHADPDYSDLLEQLYDQSTRQANLRGYFEPTEQEREEGKKLPTRAHRAIARLVRGGYVRVIITPNFDHLIEDAIRAEGIEPVIVSTADAIDGAPPLAHVRCLIVKVHGDYLDARIKNTKAELAAYDARLDRLLDQILDGFGLIVCGWSADWDPALRGAVERAPNRRYATFWTGLTEPSAAAQKLTSLRAAKFIKIESADAFFDALAERVTAVAESDRPNPVDAQVTVALAKRYVAEGRHRVRLHDLLIGEAQAARARLVAIEGEHRGGVIAFNKEIERRFHASEKLLLVLAACGFHARGGQVKDLRRCAETLGAAMFGDDGRGLHPLLLYSAALAIYVTSLAAMADGHDRTAAEMIKSRGGRAVERGRVLPLFAGSNFAQHVRSPVHPRSYTPASDHLHARCLALVAPLYPEPEAFDLAFDRFEYIQSLVARDDEAREGGHFFNGRWMWRAGAPEWKGFPDVRSVVRDEVGRDGESWPYLAAGLFGGSLKRLNEVKEAFDADTSETVRRMGSGTA